MRSYVVTLKHNKGYLNILADNLTVSSDSSEYRFYNTDSKEPIMVAAVMRKKTVSVVSTVAN